MIDGGPYNWTRADYGNDLIHSVRSRGLRHYRVRPVTWFHRAVLPRLASSSCPCGIRQTEYTVREDMSCDLWMDSGLCDWTHAIVAVTLSHCSRVRLVTGYIARAVLTPTSSSCTYETRR